MLARFRICVATEFLRVSAKERSAGSLYRDRRHLSSTGNALQLLPKPLTVGQFMDLDPPSGREFSQRRLQRGGV